MASGSRSQTLRIAFLLLLISAVGNVLLYVSVNRLESAKEEGERRLVAFANVTGRIVREARMSREDVMRSGMVGYPATKVGDGYVIEFDEHMGWGYKLLFDRDDKLIGWEEYPPASTSPRRNFEANLPGEKKLSSH